MKSEFSKLKEVLTVLPEQDLSQTMKVAFGVGGYASIHFDPQDTDPTLEMLGDVRQGLRALAILLREGRTTTYKNVHTVAVTSWILADERGRVLLEKLGLSDNAERREKDIDSLVRTYQKDLKWDKRGVPESHRKTQPGVMTMTVDSFIEGQLKQ